MQENSSAVSKYCQLRSSLDQFSGRLKTAVDPLKSERERIGKGLLEWMREHKCSVIQLPEVKDEASGKVQHRCIRIRNTTSQRAITVERVKSALAPIFHDSNRGVVKVAEVPVAEVTDMVYKHVRDVCTVGNQTILVSQTARRPGNLPKNQAEVQNTIVKPNLEALSSIAEAYLRCSDGIKERKAHYGEAKKIVKEQMTACEPQVCEYLQAQAGDSSARAKQHILMKTGDGDQKYVMTVREKKSFPKKAHGRLTLEALKKIIDAAVRRRTEKLLHRGIDTLTRQQWNRYICNDVIVAVELFLQKKNTTAGQAAPAEGRGHQQQQILLRRLPAATSRRTRKK